MEFDKTLQIGNIKYIENICNRIFNKHQIRKDNFLDTLIANNITWHCGGMSDPFQPIEEKLNITKQMIDITNKYNIHILFSTKSDTVYNCVLDNNLHTFQLSVSNVNDRKDIEPNVPNISNRLKFFKELKSKGFKVGIRIQPFIPNITTTNIIEMFKDADYFTIEGLKLVPQNEEMKQYLLKLTGLSKDNFKQMGLLNLKPEIREKLYKPFIEKLQSYNIPFSIADNDMHYISSGKCCCGDVLTNKTTDFNNTALIHNYGDYSIHDVCDCLQPYNNCICNQLFTSNRQEGCKTVEDFYIKRFDRKSSPFSPKFLYKPIE